MLTLGPPYIVEPSYDSGYAVTVSKFVVSSAQHIEDYISTVV